MVLKKTFYLAIISFILTATSEFTAIAEPPLNAQGYWDNEAMRNAKPIELQMDRKTGIAQLVSNTSSSLTNETGTDWAGGWLPQSAVGKIFFTIGGSNYVCSGALVSEAITNKSLVLTAGHCVIEKGQFVKNFMFIPNYDSYVASNGQVSVPDSAKWYASNLIVRSEFASAKQFNTNAIQHDWAFAVIPSGSFVKDKKTYVNGSSLPDSNGNSFTLSVPGFVNGATSTAFGYPAGAPYSGKYLIYARSPIFLDPSPQTWGMSSTLTGGASGGPWLSELSSDFKTGAVSSVNSYKYTNDPSRMYGPKFGAKTTSTYNAAIAATGSTNVVVSN